MRGSHEDLESRVARSFINNNRLRNNIITQYICHILYIEGKLSLYAVYNYRGHLLKICRI